MKAEILKIAYKLRDNTIDDKEARALLLILFGVIPRSFVSIAKAKEYAKKYNELSGNKDCYWVVFWI